MLCLPYILVDPRVRGAYRQNFTCDEDRDGSLRFEEARTGEGTKEDQGLSEDKRGMSAGVPLCLRPNKLNFDPSPVRIARRDFTADGVHVLMIIFLLILIRLCLYLEPIEEC